MTEDEFRAALVRERFAVPVRQWHPSPEDQAAGRERMRLAEETLDDEEWAA